MSDNSNKNTPPVSDAAMAAAVKYVSEQMIPAAVAAAVAATTKSAPQAAPAPKSALSIPTCTECGQKVTGCEGKHAKMVVYPVNYPQYADYFTGVILNGVKYLSNDGGHEVVVPANCVGTINAIVAGYEKNEQEMAIGRRAERHSGHVTPRGSSVQPANQAWR